MKVQLKIMVVGFIVITTLFTSCNKDGEANNSATTVEQDKDNIQLSFDAITTNLTQLRDGSFYQAGVEFLNLKNGEVLNSDWVSQLGDGLGDVIDGNSLYSDNRFNFSSLSGKYTWNRGTNTWSRTTNSTVIALFPSSKTSTTNNCELGISKYTDKSVVINGESGYLPSAAKAYLKKDNVQIMSVDFTANYNIQNFPTDASVQLYLKPVTTTASFSRKTDVKYSFEVSVENENNKDNTLSIQSDVSFSTGISTYDDLNNIQINSVQLTLSQGKLGINGTVDVKTIRDLENSSSTITASDINKTINLAVLYNNQNIGTLKVEDVGNTNELFIVYKDGTEENTSIYYDDFISNIESIFKSDFSSSSIKSAIRNHILKAKARKLKKSVMFWEK